MAFIGSSKRKYAKDQLKKLRGEGNFVSGVEKQQMHATSQDASDQILNAQQTQLNQAAQSVHSGSPIATDQYAAMGSGLARAGQDAAVANAAQENLAVAQLNDDRGREAGRLGTEVWDRNRQNFQTGLTTAKWGADHLIKLGTMGMGGLGGMSQDTGGSEQMTGGREDTQLAREAPGALPGAEGTVTNAAQVAEAARLQAEVERLQRQVLVLENATDASSSAVGGL
jgi:hypothetical protein